MIASTLIAGRRLGARAVVAGVVVAALSLAPARASAACGDYVTIKDGAVVGTPVEATRHPAPPCDGPNCSNRPSAPVTPPAPVSPTSDAKACLATVDNPAGFGSRMWVVPKANPHPVHRPARVYHPPRA